MKHKIICTLLFAGLFVITACSKNDEPKKKDADITAELVLPSGEQVDFSYTMDQLDFFHGPDESGNGYIIQLYPRATIDGTHYAIMIDARLNGAGEAGQGAYKFHETLGDDIRGVFIRVGVQANPSDPATLHGYASEVENPGGLVITEFSDHHISGTFSGTMNSQMSNEALPVIIKNGAFSFDF